MSRDTWALSGGRWATTSSVAQWLASTGLNCLTISGGEPMEQAAGFARLIKEVRLSNNWVVTCYTGYTLDELSRMENPGVGQLLGQLDLLIDGRYEQDLHAPLLWRGSSNQRIHNLTGRVALPADESAGLSAQFNSDGSFRFIGVPPEPEVMVRFAKVFESTSEIEFDEGHDPKRSVLPFESVPFRRLGEI